MKLVKYLFPVSILILLMAACTDKSLSPIFYTLETERSLEDDRGLEDEMIVHEVVKVGTRYFAAGNTLFTRTETGNWTSVSPPVAGALCNTIEVFGGNLYAGFFAIDGTGLGLYRTDPTGGGWNPKAPGWDNSAFDAAVQNGVQIGLIKALGTDLYVSTAEKPASTYEYYLYASTDGTTFTQILFDAQASIAAPITDIEVYSLTPEYWVIAGGDLYADTVDGTLDDLVLQSGDPQTTPGFGGLLVSTDLYLSAKDGKLWMWDGLVWSSESVTDAPSFTKFVDVDPATSNGDIFVGTEGTGYYQLAGGVLTNPQRRPEYNISALYSGAINSFYLDSTVTPEALFACTTGAGLWRGDWDGAKWVWVQE